MERVYEGAKRKNFTATTTIGTRGGQLLGILVASSSSGTVKLADPKGNICNTMSVSAAAWYPMPCEWSGELTITVTGTLDATAFYNL